MKTIPVGSAVALVDDADYERLARYRWSLNQGYAQRTVRAPDGWRSVSYMHREVMGLGPMGKDRIQVDHISQDRLDNRRTNLRLVTQGENQQNRTTRSRSRTGVRGVSVTRSGRFRAMVCVGGQVAFRQNFRTLDEASAAVAAARARLMTHAPEARV